jgi:uncharacterized RDD family membrane protein YckC/DNA-directed RNA polymerase subunit M/transcription elongation factor TFIIS
MPIKVRCPGCEAVLNVSDQAAGKAIKCKQCGGRVKVPVPKAKAPVESEPADSDDLFSGAALRSVEDTKRKVCPGCAAPVHQDDIECPKCGVTIATGGLSERQRRRRARQGPPPEEFYRDVWGNAWKFLMKHKRYAVQSAVVWALTLAMTIACLFSLRYYVTNRITALEEMVAANPTNIQQRGNYITITVPNESGANVEFDGTYYTEKGKTVTLWAPHIMAWREPPTIFWVAMTIVFQLGFGGWAWTLATKIAGLTMSGEKKIKRFQADFFANLTMGFRFYFWPVILTLPLLVIAALVGVFVSPVAGGIVAGAVQIVPLLVLPAAVVHMAQRYSFRAWLPTWMLRDFFKTFAASMYVFVMNLFLVFIIPIALIVTVAVLNQRLLTMIEGQEAAALRWLASNVNDFGSGNVQYLFYRLPLVLGSSFLFFFLICLILSFPAVFMMRVIGLYGVYFRSDLAIVNEFPDLEPATFGPRYLAFVVDLIILTLLAGVGAFIGSLFGMLFNFYGWSSAQMLSWGVMALATLVIWGLYFSRGESGAARATLGKWSLGMIVLRDDNLPQSKQQAMKRAACALLSLLTLFIGFIICAFRPDRKALHDLMSKTKVIWQGETT